MKTCSLEHSFCLSQSSACWPTFSAVWCIESGLLDLNNNLTMRVSFRINDFYYKVFRWLCVGEGKKIPEESRGRMLSSEKIRKPLDTNYPVVYARWPEFGSVKSQSSTDDHGASVNCQTPRSAFINIGTSFWPPCNHRLYLLAWHQTHRQIKYFSCELSDESSCACVWVITLCSNVMFGFLFVGVLEAIKSSIS